MAGKTKGSLLEGLFGLIFLSVGLAAAYFSVGHMIVGYIASSHWVEVPAKIHSMKFSSESGSATYSYYYDGVKHTSDRLSLNLGSDNFSDYWQDLEQRLRSSQRNNELFAFVNPKDPSQSLLDRTLRWQSILFGLVFFVAFGGVGAYTLWIALFGVKTETSRLRETQHKGLADSTKLGGFAVVAFGAVFFLWGLVCCGRCYQRFLKRVITLQYRQH